MPASSDLGLRCTNLRTLDGKRPVFVDDMNSVFFFAYEHIRFVEIPPSSLGENADRPVPIGARSRGGAAPRGPAAGGGRSRSTRTSYAASARSRQAVVRSRRRGDAPSQVRVRAGPGATLPAVPKNLVIVESPAKARTIERYLGSDYRVLASYGHVRDLPENPGKGKFGVDVDNDFAPDYVISRGPAQAGRRHREGRQVRGRRSSSPPTSTARARRSPGTWPRRPTSRAAKTHRVTFNEITEPAIREAFAHPRQIDQNLVDAQQTRRIVDRLVGYTLSPLLSRKVRGGLSAGRVQSVAVRLVVEREREITSFVAREYWTIQAILEAAWRRAVRRGARAHRRRGDRRQRRRDGHPSRRGDRPLASGRHQGRSPNPEALACAAVHDLDPPAGGEPSAELQPQAHDVGRPAPLRGRRDQGRATSGSSPTCEPIRPRWRAWPWARRAT